MAIETPIAPEMDLHEGQRAVYRSEAPTRVVAHGRRWGGSTLVVHDVLEYGHKHPDRIVWVFAASQRMALLLLDRIDDLNPPTVTVQRTLRKATVRTGTEIRFLSASGEPPLTTHRGELPDYVAIDTAEMVERDDFEKIREAADLATVDKRLFVGTPFGYAEEDEDSEYPGSWLWDHFKRGFLVGTGTECWRYPTWDNPYVMTPDLAEQEKMMEDEQYRQMFGARWLARDGDSDSGVDEDRLEELCRAWERKASSSNYHDAGRAAYCDAAEKLRFVLNDTP